MQTLKEITVPDVVQAADKKITCIGRNLYMGIRFGKEYNKRDIQLAQELAILKDTLCMPTCIDKDLIIEIINKKTQ